MRLGIGTYTFAWAIGFPGHAPRQPMSAFDLLERAEHLGVRVVQVCDNLPLTGLTDSELDRFKDETQRLGISVELGARGLDREHLRKHMDLCLRLGSPFLRLVIDSPGDEPSPAEAVKRLNPIVKEFGSRGVQLALENHDRFPSATLAGMIDQLGCEHVGICLDTVNSFGALEGPDVVVETLSELTLSLHVKDFTISRMGHNMGFVVEGCPAGQGRLNVPWLLKRLESRAANVNAILETWVSPSNSLEETVAREATWAEEGIGYLRTLIPE